MKLIKIIKNKITLFDIVLGVFLLVFLIAVVLFLDRKTQYVDIRVKVTDQDVLYSRTNPATWYANRFNVGDSEKNELGRPIAQITNVETYNTTADTKAVYLNINVRAVYDKMSQTYSAKGTSLIFGNTLKFSFPNVSFSGLIIESPTTSNPVSPIEQKKIVVLQRGIDAIEPVILQKIKVGDEIIDSMGNILAHVESVSFLASPRITQTYQGDLLLRNDPYYKDAFITLTVRVKKYNNEYFLFDNVPLKLGVNVPLNFSYESIYPVIIDIK